MKAFIFAAGLGKRLQPLTNNKPKALVEVQGKTLLEHAINKLRSGGFQDIIINIHYLGEQIVEFIHTHSFDDVTITISDESDLLLDTGGALKNAAWFFDQNEPFIIYNVDVISDINLNNMLEFHQATKAMATLAVRTRESSRYLLFDNNYILKGWENTKSGERISLTGSGGETNRQAFSGIHIVDPTLFNYFPSKKIFPVTELYLSLMKNKTIKGFNHDHTFWFDVGTPKKLKKAQNYLNNTGNILY